MKTAFVLSGGGAKGCYQVGVLKQLSNLGIVPDIMYGTSVGALNSSVLSYKNIDDLTKEWLLIESKNDTLTFNKSMLFLSASGLYNLDPLRKNFLEPNIGEIPNIETKVCRINIETGETEYVSNYQVDRKSFIDAVIDSSTIPLAISLRDKYIDGGVRECIPLEIAIDEGATDIYVILCTPLSKNPPFWDYSKQIPFFKFFNVVFRSIDSIMDQEVKWNDLTVAIHKMENINIKVFSPPKFISDTLEFDPKKIREGIQLGLEAIPVNFKEIEF